MTTTHCATMNNNDDVCRLGSMQRNVPDRVALEERQKD